MSNSDDGKVWPPSVLPTPTNPTHESSTPSAPPSAPPEVVPAPARTDVTVAPSAPAPSTQRSVDTAQTSGQILDQFDIQSGGLPTVSLPATGAVSSVSTLTLQLHATAQFPNQAPLDVTTRSAWRSDNPGVATVDQGGLVSYVSEGAANVYATYRGVQSGACAITASVESPPPPPDGG